MKYEKNTVDVVLAVNRNKAIAAGRSQHGNVSGTIDPATLNVRQRQALVECGDKPLNYSGNYNSFEEDLASAGDTPEEFAAIVAEVLTARAKFDNQKREKEEKEISQKTRDKEAKAQEQIAILLSLPAQAMCWFNVECMQFQSPDMSRCLSTWVETVYVPGVADRPALKDHLANVRQALETKLQEIAAKREVDDRIELEQLRARERLFGELLTDTDMRRRERGLMSANEENRILRDWIFIGDGKFDRFTRLKASDVEHDGNDCMEYDDPTIDFEVYEGRNADLTSTEFENLETIELRTKKSNEILQKFGVTIKITPREHVATCENDNCTGSARRASVLLTAKIQGESGTLSREYALSFVV